MIRSFFDVIPVELNQLGADPAVAVLREMLWAEVHNIGIPISDTDIPFNVSTADGGIDAAVKAPPTKPGNGLIFAPLTSYQVKAGKFDLSDTTKGLIEELLIRPKSIAERVKRKVQPSGTAYKPDDISPRVRSCLDKGGTFVTMLFGNDSIDTEDDATEEAIRAFLGEIDPQYAAAEVKVWRQSKICGLLRQFPAVSLQIKNLADFQLLSHEQWALRGEMSQAFVPAPGQQKIIDALRMAVRDDSHGAIHIRMIGEPGIGKTRLVLEALRADDLKPLVLYADRATHIDGSVVSAIYAAKHARIILVVDECGPDARSNLVRHFSKLGPTFKVISIYQDIDEADGASEYRLFAVPGLPDTEIETIVKSYGVDTAATAGWAELCEGSPRVAHVIGQNLKEHPTDPLKSDGTAQIWVRFLAADVDRNSEEYRKRQLVMSSLALFKRFGWGAPVQEAAYEIFDRIVRPLDAGISKAQFGTIIEQMAARKVLQGDNFLYITPRALHIRLWIDWWGQHGGAINMIDVVPQLSPQLRQWFGEMIEYAAAAPVSKRLVSKMLGPDGVYRNAEWLNTKEGAKFFFSLSLADPRGAVAFLERTIGKMDRKALLGFEAGRRDVIWALEGTALHSDLFIPSAKLLLALAEAENETWSNNATGVFAGLFSLGYGAVAPTSLAPEHRLAVLRDALKNGGSRAAIALTAFDTAFTLHSITRWGSDQPFRLGERVARWLPKTQADWFAAYELYWQALRALLKELSADLRRKGISVLLSRAREILAIKDMNNEVIDTLRELSDYPEADTREVISEIEMILNYDEEALSDDTVKALGKLRDELVGTTFASRMQRYVGMDLLQDHYDNEGKESDKITTDVRELAREALENPEKLRGELSWLVTHEARNGYRFGHVLGELDTKLVGWPSILEAWYAAGKNAHDFFVGGYLRAVFERDTAEWETIIYQLAGDTRNVELVPVLVCRSGMSDSVAALLLDLGRKERVRAGSFGMFATGRTSATLSDSRFAEWLDFLMDRGSFEAAATALNLASMAMLGGRKLSADQIKKILIQPPLFAKQAPRHSDVMLTHYWLQLSKTLIKQNPDSEMIVLRKLIENIGNSGAITDRLGPEGERYLDEMVARRPVEAWQMVSEYINPPMDTRGFVITRWLRGDQGFRGRSPGPMRHIPREVVSKWIEGDSETRAPYVAQMAPKDFTPESWNGSLIREVLRGFGDRDSVRSAVFANFFTGGWSGPASIHYTEQRDQLLQIKSSERDPLAIRWLNDAIASLEQSIEQAKIEEEVRGY